MISSYNPILKKSNSESPEWYKNFHTVLYLSQLTNQILLSYLDTQIENDKEYMIRDSSLFQRKIIKTDSETGMLVISKPEILKSIHIEDTIDQIIKNVFEGSEQRIDVLLNCMGLILEDGNRRDIAIDRDILLESTTSKNWYDLIKSLLNVWEFIFLYGAIESTFKSILIKEGSVREENLLGAVFDKFDGLSNHFNFKKVDIERVWFFYTELRNIYCS